MIARRNHRRAWISGRSYSGTSVVEEGVGEGVADIRFLELERTL
jgi:hypothetical protein